MSQQKSILNYFTKSPKVSTTISAPSTTLNSSPSGSGSRPNGTSSPSTPKSSKTNSAVRRKGIPKNNNTDSPRTPKRCSADMTINSPTPTNEKTHKRVRTEEISPGIAGNREYTEGNLVWAKLEGYPWWPGLVRAENPGETCFRKNFNEFHVQFFDNPPSRAWMRKVDMKPYQGSTDGAVPPARTDPTWIEACKSADNALAISPKKRIDKFWVNFDTSIQDLDEPIGPPDRKGKAKVRNGNPSASNDGMTKRRRIIIESESSDEEIEKETKTKPTKFGNKNESKDDEYNPNSSVETIANDLECVSSSAESGCGSDDIEELTIPAKKIPVRSAIGNTPKSTSSAASLRTPARQLNHLKPKILQSIKSPKIAGSDSSEEGRWPHLKLRWLKPEFIQDKKMRGQDNPDYDPKSLHIPSSFLESLTPAVRQWWEMKSENFDCILFFKLGKFYEMYHMDAVCGVEELGLIFMKGDLAHCGFPETGYSRYADILVQKGYKVARVEQTETPDMMTERCKKQFRPSKFDRVVKREICQFTTQGVRIASVQDVNSHSFQPNSEFLYALLEKTQPNGPSEYGACFVDTTIGTFHIGQFKDDRHCSRLRTLLAHHNPVEILHEKKLSATFTQLLGNLSGIRKNGLVSESEFWDAQKTLKVLAEGSYFRNTENDPVDWPESLKIFQSENDSLGLTPSTEWELGIRCLGAVIYYLTKCLVEHDLLSLRQFEVYYPIDSALSDKLPDTVKTHCTPRKKFMVLDAVTLRNLEITHGPKNLLSLLDRCGTQFGKRLLRQWTCSPLAIQEGIMDRLDAIEELMTLQELRGQIFPMLKSLLDLERLLNKVHSLGSQHHSKDHPDARAIMFEEKKYSKRKILDLTSILKNFKTCVSIITAMKMSECEFKSGLLQNIISEFPSLDSLLDFFDNAFDHTTALEGGKIIPVHGVDPEYDLASQNIRDLTNETSAYLKEMQNRYHRQVKYFGNEKKRFQLEIPDTVRVPNDFEMSSNRKGFKRYYTVKTKEFLARILQLETTSENVLKDITRRIFAQFDKHRETWRKAVNLIGMLDVLISLTVFSESQENMCRPSVCTSEKPFINIKEGRHPALSQDTYIPNNTQIGKLGSETESLLLLTGPNMGGKSTLMRQVGVITVLAHLGCYVPATKCNMTLVDRIFTRLGANDNIGEGESTFFVELSETSVVLQHSTSDSLVLMDELGRGTATYDGTAIAYAVAKALANIQCRSIFSTHYHTLVESLQNVPSIQLGHMACMVENENEDDPTDETITFLYKLIPGACPKSYGFNAAKLAGIPDDIIRLASKKAKELERNVKRMDLFRHICNTIDKKSFTLKDLKLMKVS